MQGGVAGIGGGVDVGPQLEGQLDRRQRVGHRPQALGCVPAEAGGQPARMAEVDGLEGGGRVAQRRRLQPPGELALLAGGPLEIDEQAEAVFEAQRGGLVGAELLKERLGQGGEFHRVQPLKGLFDQHRSSSRVGNSRRPPDGGGPGAVAASRQAAP